MPHIPAQRRKAVQQIHRQFVKAGFFLRQPAEAVDRLQQRGQMFVKIGLDRFSRAHLRVGDKFVIGVIVIGIECLFDCFYTFVGLPRQNFVFRFFIALKHIARDQHTVEGHALVFKRAAAQHHRLLHGGKDLVCKGLLRGESGRAERRQRTQRQHQREQSAEDGVFHVRLLYCCGITS